MKGSRRLKAPDGFDSCCVYKNPSAREYLYPALPLSCPLLLGVRFFPPLLIFCQADFKMAKFSFLIKLIRLKWKCSQRSVSMEVVHSYHKLLLSVHLVSSIYRAALSHVSLTELLISAPGLQAVWSNFCGWYLHPVWCVFTTEGCPTLTPGNQSKFAELVDKELLCEKCNLKATSCIDRGPFKKSLF